MASAGWTRPEDFLRIWRQTRAFREGRPQHQAFVTALALLGMARLTHGGWVFRPPTSDEAVLLAVRSLCHGAYTGEPLRLPIAAISVPPHICDEIQQQDGLWPEEVIEHIAAFVRDRLCRIGRDRTDLAVVLQLTAMPVPRQPETLPRVADTVAGEVSELWVLVASDATGDRYTITQLHPRRADTIVDLRTLDQHSVVV